MSNQTLPLCCKKIILLAESYRHIKYFMIENEIPPSDVIEIPVSKRDPEKYLYKLKGIKHCPFVVIPPLYYIPREILHSHDCYEMDIDEYVKQKRKIKDLNLKELYFNLLVAGEEAIDKSKNRQPEKQFDIAMRYVIQQEIRRRTGEQVTASTYNMIFDKYKIELDEWRKEAYGDQI